MMQWASKFITGFNLRSGKITGGQNLRVVCNEGTEVDGGGTDKGNWDGEDYKTCPGTSYFCGVQPRGAVNQLRFLCCRPNKDSNNQFFFHFVRPGEFFTRKVVQWAAGHSFS